MSTPEKLFSSHILRYVGVGLISGSVVHAGTLGGESVKYIVLIILGILAFIIGTYLEHEDIVDKKFVSFILISVLVSIGTGMVSGGTQHYLDGPVFASVLLPIGLLVAYIAYVYRDFRSALSIQKILVATLLATLLGLGLYSIAHRIPTLENHHSQEESL